MVLQTIEQLYSATLRYYSKKFDQITVFMIDSFKFNFQEDMDFQSFNSARN